jgi:hypothetical protein
VTQSVGKAAIFHLKEVIFQPDNFVAHVRNAYILHVENQKINPTCLFNAGDCSALKTVIRPA